MAIKTIGVIGAGQMGNGICQVAAFPGGINVIMNDIAEQFVNKGFDAISKNLDRLVGRPENGNPQPDQEEHQSRGHEGCRHRRRGGHGA
jgi:3-hydroxybutyryl-CoA dehydrogenase